jgi:UDP-N-acetylmuramoylalanine--D-glutamate ligase
VPIDSPYIAEAKKENVKNMSTGAQIKMSASWFAEIAQIPIVGVTGTRGKSSVTYMLEAIYTEAGKKTLLGGNVQGVSTLSLLPDVTPDTIGIFELDSWQLQGFGDSQISPHIAVFTTFYNDHLNYYHGDVEQYLDDKAQIFLYQKKEDVLVLGKQCAELIQEKYVDRIKGHVVTMGAEDLPAEWQLQIPGEHNRYNAALALAAARAEGILDSVSRAALEAFAGVPGRLQRIRTVDGVDIYNDTNSTTPEATLVALQAISTPNHADSRGIILIMGGADKGLDMSALITELTGKKSSETNHSVKRVILLAGTGTERIQSELPDAEVYENLAMAVKDARDHADPGDVILFSPAFASFGMFVNEYDRGDRFMEVIKEL